LSDIGKEGSFKDEVQDMRRLSLYFCRLVLDIETEKLIENVLGAAIEV